MHEIKASDATKYRPNVAMLLINDAGCVWLGERSLADGGLVYQIPQGGIDAGESPEQAMWRELYEELGLDNTAVRIVGRTQEWIPYVIPLAYRRSAYIGQKQLWFLLHLHQYNAQLNFDCTDHAEFLSGRWVTYWYPLSCVAKFKYAAYQRALSWLAPQALQFGV